MKALPRTIHLSATGHEATSGWLSALLNIAVRESGTARAGRDNILARMSELMFVEAIRRHVETLPPSQTGWLAGLRDAVVGQHGRASRRTNHRMDGRVLARVVGVSRSVLADRFAEMVGQPPMHT